MNCAHALDTPVLTMTATSPLIFIILVMSTTFLNTKGNLIRNLITNNVAGPDVNFKEVKYKFDPEAAIRRSVEYQEVNGVLGWKAIERIGLGEDGKTEERREKQKYRDSIGALSYLVPGS